MKAFQQLQSPVELIEVIHDVELWVKREDLIHPHISGNKWRKLKYYMEDFRRSGKESILTFGGAFSNHLAATAALGKMMKIPTTGVVRGEEVKDNHTLEFCRGCGMEMLHLSREVYRGKDEANFISAYLPEKSKAYVIPEGGKGMLGLKGCMEIMADVAPGFDLVCCSAGTATTFSGLVLSGYDAEYRMYPALKGAGFLLEEVRRYLESFLTSGIGKITENPHYDIAENYHFGGYAKVQPELIDFMNGFFERYRIPLDPVYTGKMMFGIVDEIRNGRYPKGTKILSIHTGGLQGIKGMNCRLRKMGKKLEYEA